MPVESRRRSYSVPGFRLPLRVGSHCSPGYLWDAVWIKRRVVQPERGKPSRFSVSILDQADNPRRLAPHDDDSDVSSCAYPYATVLDGIRWWVQRDRLSFPLHGVEDQSRPWGPCVTPASGGEELHLYGTQVIKDLAVSTPHPWLPGHFEGTDRSFPVWWAFPSSEYSARYDSPAAYGGLSL